MAITLQLRRGSNSQNDSFTGDLGEVTVDTTAKTLRVHDGSTAGGQTLVNLDSSQTLNNKTLTSPFVTGNTTFTGDLLPSANVTYNLGSATAAWNDLYLAGNSIFLGGATISHEGATFKLFDSTANTSIINTTGGVKINVNGSDKLEIAANGTVTITADEIEFASGNGVIKGMKSDPGVQDGLVTKDYVATVTGGLSPVAYSAF